MNKKIKTTLLFAATLGIVFALASGTGHGAEKTLSAAGTVSKLDAAERTVVVAVTDGPEINGTLAPGARVTIRYTTLPDGQHLAHQISVARS
jgi:hypothetical protein